MLADPRRLACFAALLALALVAMPLLLQLPAWIPMLYMLLLAWRGWLVWHGRALPHRVWLMLALLLPIAALWFELRTLVGREGGVAFLLLLVGGKALETATLRDWRVLLALGFFLAATPLLFDQSPLSALWLVLSLFALTWAMVLLAGEEARLSPRITARALLLSFPLMVVLFVVMPRLPGPLWSMPSQQQGATTGLADSMSPGAIGKMILSREPVFTAEFAGTQPRPSQLYWRVMVFDQFDGSSWRAANLARERGVAVASDAPRLRYEVVAEPYQGYLPLLEQGVASGDGVTLVYQQRLRRLDAANQARFRYRVESIASPRFADALTDSEQGFYLSLPAGNLRTVAAAQALAGRHPQPAARLQALQLWLAEQGLRYTLNPPQLQGDVVDGFLFGSRQGFCEHFASAFTVLARAAGLPARVVVGFQGGEFNGQGRFWQIRSSDAHAWSEVWVDGSWQRVDATSLVAPQRIEAGIANTLGEAAPRMPLVGGKPPGWAQWVGQQWQLANFSWQRWVVGYDAASQQGLFQKLGLGEVSAASIVKALLGGMLLAGGPLLWWLLRRRQAPQTLPQQVHALLLRRLQAAGIAAQAADTASELQARAAALTAAERDQLAGLLQRWQRLQYAPPAADDNAWRTLLREVKAFRPARVGRKTGR
ncbi:transglutaminaseTgpA domain-containing protein [Vogesella urethralis]|uniref:transglutaminase family protein n=1 Tax=Vogesella urethralis TaxID=2592656 RepID=UPI001185DB6F|nr:DUF3488 and transglutaminase-like domain-containing protein [Vogesella urethralis]